MSWSTTTPLPAFGSQSASGASTPTRGRGAAPIAAKRGRKPRAGPPNGGGTPVPAAQPALAATPTPNRSTPVPQTPTPGQPAAAQNMLALPGHAAGPPPPFNGLALPGSFKAPETPAAGPSTVAAGANASVPGPSVPSAFAVGAPGLGIKPQGAADEDGEGDDEQLPAMADDDYSAQLKWQSQSKADLKVLMDHFSPLQRERYESYRRSFFNKQAVRRLIHQSLGLTVSPQVAQVVAGFSKVFVGEIIEKARQVQAQRRETGPLSPDHLRAAYILYQDETGRIGAARPLRGKRLFMR